MAARGNPELEWIEIKLVTTLSLFALQCHALLLYIVADFAFGRVHGLSHVQEAANRVWYPRHLVRFSWHASEQ